MIEISAIERWRRKAKTMKHDHQIIEKAKYVVLSPVSDSTRTLGSGSPSFR